MSVRLRSFEPRRRLWLVLALLLIAPLLARSDAGWLRPARSLRPGAPAHGDASHKKGPTAQEREREAWVRHQLNLRRLEETHQLGAASLTADLRASDVEDIAVLEADRRLLFPANPFDLNGRAVIFTPSGAGYVVTGAAASFDANLGTKLDLTRAPAVNPKPDADPGDDAYIELDLGFNFSLYGTTFSRTAISSNGFLTFRPNGISPAAFDNASVDSSESLSELQNGVPRIAPYWHDLDATGAETPNNRGIFLRRDADRVLVTWNSIRDFENEPDDNGVHTFQVTLFNDGRIVFNYVVAQLTTTAIVALAPPLAPNLPALIDLSAPPPGAITDPIAEAFSVSTQLDQIGIVLAFYATHPDRDVYDFIYVFTDFEFDFGGAFAAYFSIRNDVRGIGAEVFDADPSGILGSRRINGFLNLSDITQYPPFPTTRFPEVGTNSALSVMGQEQGHRWLAFPAFPSGNQLQLLGRDDSHWSFYMHTESTLSHPAARRSSSMEGNVWREDGGGVFASVGLIDGYTRLDHYLMGLRAASEVSDTFLITNQAGGGGPSSSPRPNVIVTGNKLPVTMAQILAANGTRIPDVANSQKNFRAAVVLLVKEGTQPSTETIDKVTLYRLAWESYFAQSTDYLGRINTGLADETVSRVITAASAASYKTTLAPGEIGALFGAGLTDGVTEAATGMPLPTTLAGVEVRVDGVPAPLFVVSPGQINFEVPRATRATTILRSLEPIIQSATALVEVYRDGRRIRAGAFQIAPVVPASFTLNLSGAGPAAALDALTGAPAPFNARQANGQPNIISLYLTGLGADVTDIDGDLSGAVQATIDGQAATVSYAGRAPGFTGLNQINIVFPPNLAPGTHTLIIRRNGIASQSVTIEVR